MAKVGTLPVYLQVGDSTRGEIGTLDLTLTGNQFTFASDALPKLLRAAADEFEREAKAEVSNLSSANP